MLLITVVHTPTSVLVPALSTAVLIGGLHWGRRAGILLAVAAIALEFYAVGLADMRADGYVHLLVTLFPIIAGLVGGYTGLSLRRSQFAALDAARRARVLGVALMELPTLDGRHAILRRLPELLADILGISHADVLVPDASGEHLMVGATFGWTPPPDVRLPLKSITGRAYLTGRVQHVPDAEADPDFIPGFGLGLARMRSELALPIAADGRVVAVLNLERLELGSFPQEDIETLSGLCHAVGSAIERTDRLARAHALNRTQEFLLELSRTLSTEQQPAQMQRRALTAILGHLGGDAACIWQLGMEPLRMSPGLPDDAVPWDEILSFVLQLDEGGRESPIFFTAAEGLAHPLAMPPPDCLKAFAILPLLGSDGRSRAQLGLFDLGEGGQLDVSSRGVFLRTADRLGIALQRSQTQSQMEQLLDAIRGLLTLQDIEDVYSSASAAAEALVPGTEVAALLVAREGAMRVVGSPRYRPDRSPYDGIATVAGAMHFYGPDAEAFQAGRPRLATGLDVPEVARAYGVQANLSLPIVSQERLLAVLNLDSSRPDAFHSDSISLAETLALELGAIIQQASYREQLEQLALTDALTQIGNRRAFDARLQTAWAEAQRYGHPISLIIVDLQGFKLVNDQFGHQAGDAALVAIAQSMNRVRRDGDALFRWGGDEFAIILTHADLPAAIAAAHRYMNAIQSASTTGPSGEAIRVGANMGVASAPTDADTIAELISTADQRVFRAKANYRPVEPQTSL